MTPLLFKLLHKFKDLIKIGKQKAMYLRTRFTIYE